MRDESVPSAGDPIGISGVLVSIGLFALGLAVLAHTLQDGRSDVDSLFTSDTLFPTRVYDDLVRDRYPLSGWQYPVAPFWFPDIAGYVCVRGLVGHTSGAVVLYGFLQFTTLVCSFAFLAYAVRPDRWRTGISATFVLGTATTAILAYTHFQGSDWNLLFQLQLHVGALIITALAPAASLLSLRANKPLGRSLWLLVLAGLLIPTIASDRIAILWCIVPLLGSLSLAWVVSLRSPAGLFTAGGRVVVLVVVILASVVLADRLYRRYHGNLDHVSQQQYQRADSDSLVKGLAALAGHLPTAVQSPVLVWVAVSGTLFSCFASGQLLRRFCRETHPSSPRSIDFLAVYFVILVGLSVPVVAALGMVDREGYPWPWAFKYLQPVFFVPWFGLACLAVQLPMWAARVGIAGLALVSVGLLVVVLLRPLEQKRSVWRYYPEDVRRLDEWAERYGLEYGLGSFWEAHRTTALSRRGLKVYSIQPSAETPWGFTVFHWLGNRYWYTGDPPHHPTPRWTFVVLGQKYAPDAAKAVAELGPPVATERVKHITLLVYNQPHAILASAVRFDGPFITSQANLSRFENPLTYAGIALPPGDCGRVTPEGDRVATSSTGPGHLTITPQWKVVPGRYELSITYSGADAQGSGWHIFEHHDRSPEQTTFHYMNWLVNGNRAKDTTIITIPDRMAGKQALSVRVLFGGKGELTIHEMSVKRVE